MMNASSLPNHGSDVKSISSGSSVHGDSQANLSSTDASAASAQAMLEEKERMFQQESNHVRRLKRIVLLVMFLAAVLVCTTVWYVTEKAERDQLEATYEGAAEKLLGK